MLKQTVFLMSGPPGPPDLVPPDDAKTEPLAKKNLATKHWVHKHKVTKRKVTELKLKQTKANRTWELIRLMTDSWEKYEQIARAIMGICFLFYFYY